MNTTIGIRREDKNEWERRVPLVPDDLAHLRHKGFSFVVQPSAIRIFDDEAYRAAGVAVDEDLSAAGVVVAVKEIPLDLLRENTAYLFFSHTVKGQKHNMPLLRRLLDLRATLIDYERIVDEQNRRLIFFSLHAGLAGMLETLVALGRRLAAAGRRTPLAELKPAHAYADLAAAKTALRAVGAEIAAHGLGDWPRPVIIGLAGYGNVARGCREILDCLPVRELAVPELAAAAAGDVAALGPLAAVTFREEHMVAPRAPEAQFVLQDYYQRPQNYKSVFADHLAHLDVLVNTIYWDTPYPRLVTRKWAKEHYGAERAPRLQVIGDISCDIEGSVELTLAATKPDEPCFVYDPATDRGMPGVAGNGPAVMAVDNLPCELPREASAHFSGVLRDMVPALARADFRSDFASLQLPSPLKRAVVCHRGELAPDYRYLQEHLERELR